MCKIIQFLSVMALLAVSSVSGAMDVQKNNSMRVDKKMQIKSLSNEQGNTHALAMSDIKYNKLRVKKVQANLIEASVEDCTSPRFKFFHAYEKRNKKIQGRNYRIWRRIIKYLKDSPDQVKRACAARDCGTPWALYLRDEKPLICGFLDSIHDESSSIIVISTRISEGPIGPE